MTPEDRWRQCIQEWYPERLSRTYFLPPLHFRKINYKEVEVPGVPLRVVQPVPPPARGVPEDPTPTPTRYPQIQPPVSVTGCIFPTPEGEPEAKPWHKSRHFVGDKSTERVVDFVRALSDEQAEPMLVISELEFRKYLDGCSNVLNAAKAAYRVTLPRFDTAPPQSRDGDFDVLIVHRHHGLMVLEIKSVGDYQDARDPQRDVQKTVKIAVNQLKKAEVMLRHLLSDLPDLLNIRITKSIALPYTTSMELLNAVEKDKNLLEDMCEALGVPDLTTAINQCLCKEQCPSPSQFSQSSQSSQSRQARTWWHQMTTQNAELDPIMTDSVYETLLARFCGPATSVEIVTIGSAAKTIRTKGEGVAEAGLILSVLALTPDQVTLLSDNSIWCIHLNGPPGTGKTVMLVVKASQMIRQGYHVLVLCINEEGRPVSRLIQRQLNHVLGPNPSSIMGTVTYRDFEDVSDAESGKFEALVSAGKLFIIADEIISSYYPSKQQMPAGLTSFIEKVKLQVPDLWVWCASVQSCVDLPLGMASRTLSDALRTHPAVTALVQEQLGEWRRPGHSAPPAYSPQRAPAATAGPSVRRWPRSAGWWDSASDVQEVGRRSVELLTELHVGTRPDALHFRDVIILADSGVKAVLPGISAALRAGDVPCQTLGSDCSSEDVGLALTDSVTLARVDHVPGLERRVVIALGDTGRSINNWLAASRCTGLLVLVGYND